MSFFYAKLVIINVYLVNLLLFQCALISGVSYMHRRTIADLLPLDTKLEKTIINLKKEKAVIEASVMADQGESNQNIPVV